MANARDFAQPPVMFVAGDDAAKKRPVLGPVGDLGFEAVDAGPLRVARLLEPYGMLWIDQALARGAGGDFALGPANPAWRLKIQEEAGGVALDQDELAAAVRAALVGAGDIREVKMFGGIGFMLNGNMVAAASKRGLLVRVGKEAQSEALAQPGTRPMVMRGRVMDGYVYRDPPALDKTAAQTLLRLAAAFVQTLPPKRPGAKSRRAVHRAKR